MDRAFAPYQRRPIWEQYDATAVVEALTSRSSKPSFQRPRRRADGDHQYVSRAIDGVSPINAVVIDIRS